MQCPKCRTQLDEVLTHQGVVIDRCPSCRGIWLDEGELFLFSKNPEWLEQAWKRGLLSPKTTDHRCPRCEEQLQCGGFVDEKTLVDHCPSCRGLWLDEGELQMLLETAGEKVQLQIAEKFTTPRWEQQRDQERRAAAMALTALPNLAMRSGICFLLLYGTLFFVLILAAEMLRWPFYIPLAITAGIVLVQYIIAPWILDFMLRCLFSFRWVDTEELPEHLQQFLQRVCREKGIHMPKFGIIEDGGPNAFTYGRSPSDARVVVTQGLLNYLEPDEVEAVVGHEIGHACHWDILVMTIASMVPVVLYSLYRISIRLAEGRSRNNPFGIIAIVAFLAYLVTEYIVLWLSRAREYWADRFGGEVTGNPDALSRALVKVAYGLVDVQKEGKEGSRIDSLDAMGIFDVGTAKALSLPACVPSKKGEKSEIRQEQIAGAMQWDLWNPWASFYEFHSTHPLPAKRIDALSRQSLHMDKEPSILFHRRKPESYWDEFAVDVFWAFLQDETGIVFLDYRQPLRILEYFFALFRSYGRRIEENAEKLHQNPKTPEKDKDDLLKFFVVEELRQYFAGLELKSEKKADDE